LEGTSWVFGVAAAWADAGSAVAAPARRVRTVPSTAEETRRVVMALVSTPAAAALRELGS
jgi:hypothetical protein